MPPGKKIFQHPFFPLLFPLFFVLHGFTVNYSAVPFADALLLLLIYLGATIVVVGIFFFLFRDLVKACLMTVALMILYFFFGNLLDLLKKFFGNEFVPRYRHVFLISLLCFAAVFILIKKRKQFNRIVIYLNILFALLILFDLISLVKKIPAEKKRNGFHPAEEGFSICDSCQKPDIFLVIPDEYPGSRALLEDFHFDNTDFETALEQRGFYVNKNSRSNYNSTPLSVASTLDLRLFSLSKKKQDYSTIKSCYDVIRRSLVLKFLLASGYKFYNCSIFDFEGQPAHQYSEFLPYGIGLITAQTLIDRLGSDFRQDVIDGKTGFKKLQEKFIYENLHFNDDISQLTKNIAAEKKGQPKFVYTHLMMPHSPYYFDRNGKALFSKNNTLPSRWDDRAFIEYLQYTNRKLLELADAIRASGRPAIIVILSDHGFRYRDSNFNPVNEFTNLNAVYFPQKDYDQLTGNISNVNMFRVIFNQYFHQQLPLLKDEMINVRKE